MRIYILTLSLRFRCVNDILHCSNKIIANDSILKEFLEGVIPLSLGSRKFSPRLSSLLAWIHTTILVLGHVQRSVAYQQWLWQSVQVRAGEGLTSRVKIMTYHLLEVQLRSFTLLKVFDILEQRVHLVLSLRREEGGDRVPEDLHRGGGGHRVPGPWCLFS